ncbi:MAG: amidophosphoribosyltransferase [Candidatus Omnitrophica bacterium CG11_big_fil_rev_8_21_14_0_20_63_9]|nr:MAG: amidophosphoribosyltransferase [Candidatus Omnitrophica bacterium CG11_big_fil_rev_8_21_14_0_20_63_9]
MNESVKHYCGLFGIHGHRDAARLTYLGLYSLQHRGEEAAGIVTFDGKTMNAHKAMGLVSEVFDEKTLHQLPGRMAIGHTRYSTTGSSTLKNSQPLVVSYAKGSLAVAHNGNLVNAFELRQQLEANGSIFQTTVDSEIILHLLARSTNKTFQEDLSECLPLLQGAFSLLFMTERELIGARDPNGFRPLCIGRLNNAYVLASETCALDIIGAKFLREVNPGEVVVIGPDGMRSLSPFKPKQRSHCLFEHVYFSRPDSYVFGESVQSVRIKLGRQLAREYPVQADLVMPIPDSGNFAALGYSQESKIPYAIGMIRNHYVGRTFIQPAQEIRDLKVRVKFNPIKEIIKGQRLVIVDDSIVRGTTTRARVKSLREAGAKEIHLRVSCPPTKFACFYGIDFPKRKELIANTKTLDEIRQFIGVDSLGYLSLEGLMKAVKRPDDYCTACWSGQYPIPFGDEGDKFALEKHAGQGSENC